MTPGRDMDAAVAEKLGWRWYRSATTGRRAIYDPNGWYPPWMKPDADGTEDLAAQWDCCLKPYSTDDGTALAHCVPWLRGKGYAVTIEYDPAHWIVCPCGAQFAVMTTPGAPHGQ